MKSLEFQTLDETSRLISDFKPGMTEYITVDGLISITDLGRQEKTQCDVRCKTVHCVS